MVRGSKLQADGDRLFTFILAHIQQEQVWPTMRECAEGVGLSQTYVHSYLFPYLEKEDLIVRRAPLGAPKARAVWRLSDRATIFLRRRIVEIPLLTMKQLEDAWRASRWWRP